MRARPCRESRVAAEVLLRHVETLCCGVYAGATESVPEFAKCKQQSERDVGVISAHVEPNPADKVGVRSRPPQTAGLILRHGLRSYASRR
jgi:hypothetical protein